MHEKLNYKNFLDVSQSLAGKLFLNTVYPWEVIPKIKDFILSIGPSLLKSEYVEIKKNVWVHNDASVSETVNILGPAIIQKNAEIRHCAFLRENVIIGENSVVGNSTEVKNSLIFSSVQIPHFNYIGDSVLGYKSHFGAGSIISNIKSDKTNVTVLFEKNKIETNLRKFGAIIGDYVEVGCNTVLNPGTIIGRNTTVYPTSMVRGVINENMIFKSPEKIISKKII